MWPYALMQPRRFFLRKKTNKEGNELTGRPRRSPSRCLSPRLLLSPSLEAAHQRRGPAGTGDLSLQWEVLLRAPVTALPPLDILRKNNKDALVPATSEQYVAFQSHDVRTVGETVFLQVSVVYLSSDWLPGGG